ncbi:unnamed protein product [Closterium sp. NIES-64]|nr:unnamed protein product [Closterium sp. NIES-64]
MVLLFRLQLLAPPPRSLAIREELLFRLHSAWHTCHRPVSFPNHHQQHTWHHPSRYVLPSTMPPVLHLAPVAAARLPFTLRASISSAPRSPIPLADLRLAILPPATLRSFSSAPPRPVLAEGHAAEGRRSRKVEILRAGADGGALAVSGGAEAAGEEVGKGDSGGEEVGRGEARGDPPVLAEAAALRQGGDAGADIAAEAEVGRSQGGGTGGGKGGARRRRKRVRLDELCVARWAQYSRSQVRSWILQGKVLVEGHPVTKAGAQVSEHADVIIKARVPKYVCRAGYKLEGALQQWGVAVGGAVALDAGLSTGGFTDCLLQHAAARVYGVDVGYGQVGCSQVGCSQVGCSQVGAARWGVGRWYVGRWIAGEWIAGEWIAGEWIAGEWIAGEWIAGEWIAGEWIAGEWIAGDERIRIDPRVVVMERTNLRHLSPSDLPEKVDLVTLDLSFISVLLRHKWNLPMPIVHHTLQHSQYASPSSPPTCLVRDGMAWQVMPAVVGVMKPGAHLIVLVKPQFEARRGQVGGGGIVRSEAVRQEVRAAPAGPSSTLLASVLERVTRGIEEFGMEVQGVMTSPITGTDGNVEFLAHFVRRPVVAAPEMVPPGESGEPS